MLPHNISRTFFFFPAPSLPPDALQTHSCRYANEPSVSRNNSSKRLLARSRIAGRGPLIHAQTRRWRRRERKDVKDSAPGTTTTSLSSSSTPITMRRSRCPGGRGGGRGDSNAERLCPLRLENGTLVAAQMQRGSWLHCATLSPHVTYSRPV